MKRFFYLILYGIVGYLIFNIALSLTEIIILYHFKVYKNILDIFVNNCIMNWLGYIFIYAILVIVFHFYNMHIVNKLNYSLEQMKERRNSNE